MSATPPPTLVVNANIANVTWNTDKCEINTTTDRVIYNVYATALGNAAPIGFLYSNGAIVGPNQSQQIYVGAGNKLTLTSNGLFTATEIGTASSAQAGVISTTNTGV